MPEEIKYNDILINYDFASTKKIYDMRQVFTQIISEFCDILDIE